MNNDIHGAGVFYLETWKAAGRSLLGWSEDEVLKWATQFAREMQSGDSWFYHERPMYYFALLLVPAFVRERLDPMDFMRFTWGIQNAVEDGRPADAREKLARMERELPLDEWREEADNEYAMWVDKGLVLREAKLSQFDWVAAQERVRKALENRNP